MMNERRRINGDSGSAAPKEVPSASVRPAARGDDHDPREPSDQFHSEADLESRGVVITPGRPRNARRLPHDVELVLNDADAFLSEVPACASDRPAKHRVVEAVPAEASFSSEVDDPLVE